MKIEFDRKSTIISFLLFFGLLCGIPIFINEPPQIVVSSVEFTQSYVLFTHVEEETGLKFKYPATFEIRDNPNEDKIVLDHHYDINLWIAVELVPSDTPPLDFYLLNHEENVIWELMFEQESYLLELFLPVNRTFKHTLIEVDGRWVSVQIAGRTSEQTEIETL